MTSHQSRLLQQERQRCSIDMEELTMMLYGGKENFKTMKEMEGIVNSEALLRQDDFHFLSYEEAFKRGMQRSQRAVELFRELKLEWASPRAWMFWRAVESESMPISLMLNMFSHAVHGQSSDEQREKWWPLVTNFKMLGCYAQTELGHGSFVRGLETRAEYDQTTEEFIINTPQLTAMKWWPGSMGKTATHALVMARLYLAGKDRGIQTFMVQLRDLKTHEPLPGITVGSIGPKMAFNTVDNGFLGLSKVRIPREHMMARFCEVSPDGRFVSHSHAKKPSYGTMLWVRSVMVTNQGRQLSRAATIAIRYSAVRQQGRIDTKAGEVAVLDYTSQQHLLFPLLATSLAYWYVGNWLANFYQSHAPENTSQIQELHATSACLKALTTYTASRGIETCRLACGGHGYSNFSGIPTIYKVTAAGEIYEGDALVLYLQTARYLMKALQLFVSGKVLSGDIKYLSFWLTKAPGTMSIFKRDSQTLDDISILGNMFECAAARLIALAGQQLDRLTKEEGLNRERAWNRASPWLIRASEAHAEALIYRRFTSVLDSSVSRPLKRLLRTIVVLYGLWRIEQNAAVFMETGTLKPADMHMVHDLVLEQLKILRPEVVGLVDAFSHSDTQLRSALGAYDGDVYTRLYAEAKKEPLNQTEVADGIHKYLKPLMKSKI